MKWAGGVEGCPCQLKKRLAGPSWPGEHLCQGKNSGHFLLFQQFLCLWFGFEVAVFAFCLVFFYPFFLEFLLSEALLVLDKKNYVNHLLGEIGNGLNRLSFYAIPPIIHILDVLLCNQLRHKSLQSLCFYCLCRLII